MANFTAYPIPPPKGATKSVPATGDDDASRRLAAVVAIAVLSFFMVLGGALLATLMLCARIIVSRSGWSELFSLAGCTTVFMMLVVSVLLCVAAWRLARSIKELRSTKPLRLPNSSEVKRWLHQLTVFDRRIS